MQSQPPLLPTPSAFAAHNQPFHFASRFNSNRGKTSRGKFSSNRSNRIFHNNHGTFTNNHGNQNYQGSRNYQGSSTFKVPYQICGSTSHEAIDCFDRMNLDICGRIPPATLVMCMHHSAKPSQQWLIDSGTISPFINDVANISSPTPYTGEDKSVHWRC
ncbi:hypothetical protein ACFX2J_000160 [Malus domestica]